MSRFLIAAALAAAFLARPAAAGEHEGKVLVEQARIQVERNNLEQGEHFAREALAEAERTFGDDAPDTATTLDLLGRTLLFQWKYVEAEIVLRRGLSIREKTLGRDARLTGISYQNLANALLRLDRMQDASQMFREAHRVFEKTDGPNTATVAAALDGLGSSLLAEGKFAEAEQVLLRSLEARERVGKIVLHVDPKMSFGTGHHETTRLSLRLLEGAVAKGMTVLDFGCGTGVLAIAAVKLGARLADGVDIDEWSITNANENVRRNRCTHRITIRKGGITAIPRKRYDLIVSNIDMPTLSANLPKLAAFLKPGCPLLISGVMVSDLDNMNTLARKLSLATLGVTTENELSAVHFQSPDARRRH